MGTIRRGANLKKEKIVFKNIKQEEIENDTHRRCTQTQCGHYLQGGCRACEECRAEPYVLKKACGSCHDCENVPDSLRWGEKKKQELKNKNKTKPLKMEVKI